MDDRGHVPMNDERHTEPSTVSERPSAPPPSSSPQSRKLRGFAAMDEARQREIASKGGRAAHEKGTAHEFSKDEARAAGKKGGEVVSQNRRHMADIGRKGGERVSQDRDHMAQIGRKGGEAVSGDRQHMAEIGRKGGESRGGSPKSQPPPSMDSDQQEPR
jgi:hypothetical protein